jgi:Skp family chaperone for outer membrane proteins
MRARAALAAVGLALVSGGPPAMAQQSGPGTLPFATGVPVDTSGSRVLIIDQEQLVLDSAFGQRVRREIEAELTALTEENRRIEAELTAEERRLTELRETLPPAEFRELADAFDARVVAIRAEQDAKGRALSQREEEAFTRLLVAAQPVFEALLAEYDAELILDRRLVFFATGRVDITAEAIERINAFLGEDVPPMTDLPEDAQVPGLPAGEDPPARP